MTFKSFLSSGLLLLCIHLAHAGTSGGSGWISSGGESFFDAKNPWFLHKQSIRYCVKFDNKTLTTDSKTAHAAFLKAFRYWQNEFAKSSTIANLSRNRSYKMGSNDLIPSPQLNCQGDEDIKILFGEGSLNANEKEYFKEKLNNYVAVTVRTSYDRKTLKGKGFVYISSDRGDRRQFIGEDSIQQPWQHQELLSWALVHELGHVFGIPHTGSSFMSEVFMDILLSKYYYRDFIKNGFEPFITAPQEIKKCSITPGVRNFFSLPQQANCLVGRWKDTKSFDIFLLKNDNTEEKIASVVSLKISPYGIKARPTSYLRLTSEQTVFTPGQANYRTLVPGPLQENYSMYGRIILLKSNTVENVRLNLSPESMTVSSNRDRSIKTILSYDSPITFILSQVVDIRL